MLTSPRSFGSMPMMSLMSVDLPAPFGPTSPQISPSLSSNETPSSACTVLVVKRFPYVLERSRPMSTSVPEVIVPPPVRLFDDAEGEQLPVRAHEHRVKFRNVITICFH